MILATSKLIHENLSVYTCWCLRNKEKEWTGEKYSLSSAAYINKVLFKVTNRALALVQEALMTSTIVIMNKIKSQIENRLKIDQHSETDSLK